MGARALWQVITGQRTFQIRRIDRVIAGLHRHGGWLLYTLPMQALYVGICVVGGWFFLQHLVSGRYDLFQASGSYTNGLILLYLLNYVSITIHEMAHALTCKHYGAHVNGAGVMLYYGWPAYFVDTTDIWTKPPRARIATSWAGPYSGLILAGLCAIVVQAMPESAIAPNLHRLSFLWILILLFNLIPLLELDGYFMLIDWLEIPMLRSRGLGFFRKELWQRLRRREPIVGQERLLAWFGGLSLVFSALAVTAAVLAWQYRLKALTQALWGGGIGSRLLLISLVIVLTLPLVVGLGSHAVSTTRTAARWIRTQWRTPRGHALWEREALLRDLHFLSPLSEDELSEVATRMIPQAFRPGDAIVRQGMEADRFYVIERGVADVWFGDERMPRWHLTRGDYFGENALLDRVRHIATVRAGSFLSVLWLGRGDFDRLLVTHLSRPPRVVERIQILQALRQFPVFAGMASRELDAMASMLCRERVPAGAVVFREGGTSETFCLVASGQAEVVESGHRTRILGRGACFDEIAFLPRLPRQATVRALTPLDMFKLCRPDFEGLVATTLRRVATSFENVRVFRERASRGSKNSRGRPFS